MSRVVKVAWQQSAEQLYTAYTQERDVQQRKRLQALWLVRAGSPIDEAARLAGASSRSVERWLGWYRSGGLEAVRKRVPGHAAHGVPCRLRPEQVEAVWERCSQGQFRTYGEAQAWVAAAYGVSYTYQGMYALLARLAIHPKVPRPLAAKADPAAQAAWKKGGLRRRSRLSR